MPYVREWEAVNVALQRLKAVGQDEDQAMRDICGAIADRAIPVRVHSIMGIVYPDSHVVVPPLLAPSDLCWPLSRPRRPWKRRATVSDHYNDNDLSIPVNLLEVLREAVDQVLVRDLTPSSEAVETEEGPVTRDDSPKPRPTDPAVRQFQRNRVAGWPKDRAPPTEQEDWETARNHFGPGLTRDEFRLVRRDETPDAWRRQGRRRPRIE
jgi:hypothetical protein